MNATTIAAVLALAQTLLPIIQAGAVTVYNDIKALLVEVSTSAAATPADVASAQALILASNTANDSAYAAYEAARQAAGQ